MLSTDNDPIIIQQKPSTTSTASAIVTLPIDDNTLTGRPSGPHPANLALRQPPIDDQTTNNIPTDLGDKERTKRRYEEAAKRLMNSLSLCQGDWQPFEIPKFNDIPDNALPQIQEAIENMISVRENSMENLDFWSKKKRTVKRVFSAISPFAKHFLQVAKEGSSVIFLCPYFSIAHLLDTHFKSLRSIDWRIIASNNGLLLECPPSHN